MALAPDPLQRAREIKVPTNIIRTQEFASLNSDIRQPPLPRPRPPQPLQQRPTIRYAGIWDNQAAHAISNPNGDLRPPAFTQSQSSQGNKISGGRVGAPSNTANARPSRQLGPRPPTGPQAHNRDERVPGNGGLEPLDQGSSIGNAGGRPHRGGDQGAQRSNATQNSDDPLALNPATERLVMERDLRRKARVQRRAGTTREVEVRRQLVVQDRAQLRQQSLPHPTPSLNPTLAGSHNVHRAEATHRTLAAGYAAFVPVSGRRPPPEGFDPLPVEAVTTRALLLPRIVDTSGTPFSSDEDVSADDADSTRATIGGHTRPAYERISLHLPTAHQKRPQTKPRPRPNSSPCLICLDVPDEFPHYRPTSSCTHTSTICAPCLEQYISHAVQSEGLTTLTCPDPECRRVMEYEDVVRGARKNRECLDRYEGLLRLRRLENEPNFVRCKSPTCNWGQIHKRGAAVPMVTCEVCHAQSCFTHDVPWHTGLTCKQYTAKQQAKREAEEANQAYINQHAKICPSCGRWIEKISGCDHMTCRRPAGCGHEFCWNCLADYGSVHAPGCRSYSPPLGRYTPSPPPLLERYIPPPPPLLERYPPSPPPLLERYTPPSPQPREQYIPLLTVAPVEAHPLPPELQPRLLRRPAPRRPSQPWLSRLFGR